MERPGALSKAPKNYKLLKDPFLLKGVAKTYRYDGVLVPNDPTYPPAIPRDPRSHLTRIWTRLENLELPLPRFKIDSNYVGAPPALEVTFYNLNDNIDKPFLTEMVQKFGAVEELFIYYHPASNKHLGLGRVVFEKVKAAKACVEKFHGVSVMGKVLKVFLDAFGEDCRKAFEECTTERKPSLPPAAVAVSGGGSSGQVVAEEAEKVEKKKKAVEEKAEPRYEKKEEPPAEEAAPSKAYPEEGRAKGKRSGSAKHRSGHHHHHQPQHHQSSRYAPPTPADFYDPLLHHQLGEPLGYPSAYEPYGYAPYQHPYPVPHPAPHLPWGHAYDAYGAEWKARPKQQQQQQPPPQKAEETKETKAEEKKNLDLDTRIALLLKGNLKAPFLQQIGGAAKGGPNGGGESDAPDNDAALDGAMERLNMVKEHLADDDDDDRSSVSLSDLPINPPAPDLEPLSTTPSPFLSREAYLKCQRSANREEDAAKWVSTSL